MTAPDHSNLYDRSKGEIPPEADTPTDPNTIQIENQSLRQGFTSTPNYILRNPNVSVGAKMVYILLLSYAWQKGSCFPGQETLASDLGVSNRSVVKWIKELEKEGLIARKRRGLGKTNVYIILDYKPTKKEPNPRSEKSALLEVNEKNKGRSEKSALPKMQNMHKEEYTVEEDSELKNKDNKTTTVAANKKDVVVALTEKGITKKVAQRVVSRYKNARIYQKIEYLEFLLETDPKQVQSPAGWLRRAIEEDYAAPAGFQTPAEREQVEAQKIKAQQEQQRRLEQQEREAEALHKQREQEKAKQLEELKREWGTTKRELELWPQAQVNLQRQMTEATYGMWLKSSQLLRLPKDTGDKAVISVDSQAAKEWCENRLYKTIQRTLSGFLDVSTIELEFIITEKNHE